MSRIIRKRWKSKFARFVLDYAQREPRDARGHVMGGATLLARHLGIRPSAIYHWVRGATAPRPVHAAIIQRLARERGVRLTLDQIYGHSANFAPQDPNHYHFESWRRSCRLRAAVAIYGMWARLIP
jgi:hypothetical protein